MKTEELNVDIDLSKILAEGVFEYLKKTAYFKNNNDDDIKEKLNPDTEWSIKNHKEKCSESSPAILCSEKK